MLRGEGVTFTVVTTAESLRTATEVLAINPLNPQSLLKAAGEYALWGVIFAETGLLIGFFLPGDTLLFLAGVASSSVATKLVGTKLAFGPLLIVTPICAIAGAQLGYYLGSRYGVKLFDRPKSRVFKREYIDKTEGVFERFGAAKAVVLARFIPIVRTFLNPAAAILEMPPRRFFIWNVVGAILWTDSILLIGHALAGQIADHVPNIDTYVVPVVIVIVLIAAAPLAIDAVRKRRAKSRDGIQAEQADPDAERPSKHSPRHAAR
jgi:membrane-associated protein